MKIKDKLGFLGTLSIVLSMSEIRFLIRWSVKIVVRWMIFIVISGLWFVAKAAKWVFWTNSIKPAISEAFDIAKADWAQRSIIDICHADIEFILWYALLATIAYLIWRMLCEMIDRAKEAALATEASEISEEGPAA